MPDNFLTPILDEYTERAAALNAELTERINAAVAKAQTNILAELAGVAAASKPVYPRAKVKAKRRG